MKKIILIVLITSLSFACSPSDRAISISEMMGNATTGESVYQSNCASCHGANARGGSGPNLISELKNHDDAEFIDVILEGEGSMPGFSKLEDQAIADLMAYLHSL